MGVLGDGRRRCPRRVAGAGYGPTGATQRWTRSNRGDRRRVRANRALRAGRRSPRWCRRCDRRHEPAGPARRARTRSGSYGPHGRQRRLRGRREPRAAELAASCDAVLVLTHDAEISIEDVAHLASTLREDPGCAVVGPVMRVGDQLRVGGRYLGPGRVRHRVAAPPDGPIEVDWVDGAVLLIRRVVLDELGGFDASTFMYVDEVAFCLAVHDSGSTVKVDPGVVASQVSGAPARPRAHAFLVVRNHVRLATRRQGATGAMRATVAGVAFSLRSLVRSVIGVAPDRRFHAVVGRRCHRRCDRRSSRPEWATTGTRGQGNRRGAR